MSKELFSISRQVNGNDKHPEYVRKYVNGGFKGAYKMELKTAEIQTAGGLQGAYLLNENQILEVVYKYKLTLSKETPLV